MTDDAHKGLETLLMTALPSAAAPAQERLRVADKLVALATELCAASLPADRTRPAQAILAATFIEWAVVDNPGLDDFQDLLYATEAALTTYTPAVHGFYAREALKGGPRGQVVALTMQALAAAGDDAIVRAGDDAYRAVLSYMVRAGLLAPKP